MSSVTSTTRISMRSITAVIGFLAFVEFTSGIIQGYYTPLYHDIARFLGVTDPELNWLEAAQLAASAIAVPAFAKLGDMVGHRRMLLISTAITALATITVAFSGVFWLFLIAWAVMGFYTVWLPLEIAIVFSRSQDHATPSALTRRAAGILVGALEVGAIAGALTSGALDGALPVQGLLLIPAIAVVVCFFVVLFGIKESADAVARRAIPSRFDTGGLVLVALALLGLTGGLSLLRLNGPGSVWPWVVILLGVALFIPFSFYELRHRDPLVNVRLFRSSSLWPVFVTAGLFGVSVLGAQVPLSTFARTDVDKYGYGLGASSGMTSILIGIYLISLVAGALLLPVVTRWIPPRIALIGASLLVAIGYLLFLPFHGDYLQVVVNMLIAGLGSGALVAALPAAAASAAPLDQTGVATGLTNSVKTVGGAIASAVFGIALANPLASATDTAGTLSGYYTVWIVCGLTAVLCAVLLLFVPRHAFGDGARG
ncbi:MFS transporter [Rathayibacter sp. CAU 1779]